MGVHRITKRQRLRVLDESIDVVVVDVLHHVEALGGGADLPGVQIRGPGAAAGGDPEVIGRGDVGADDEWVLATHLEVDPRDALGAGQRHPLAGRDRAGEGDAVDALVGGQRRARLAGAGDDVDDAVGQVVKQRSQGQGRERRQLRRLADDRVAGGQRRGELPAEQQQRVVPGDDAADHAERVLDDQRQLARLDRRDHPAGRVTPDLGVVVERGGAPVDLVRVLDQGLATLGGHQRSELVLMLTQPSRNLVQQLAALTRRHRPPGLPGLPGGRDRGRRLLRRRAANGRHRLLGVGVLDRERLAVAGGSP